MSQEEQQLIQIIRDLKPFENIEIKRDEKGNLVYVYTKKERYVFIAHKLA